MSRASIPDLIELIYAASCDPAGWRPMLEALYESVGGCGANFVAISRPPETIAVHTGVGTVTAEFESEYQGAVVLGDPYYVRGKALGWYREGFAAPGQAVISCDEFRKTAFFNEFGRRHHYFGGMCGVATSTPTTDAVVTVMARQHHEFGEEEVGVLRTLLPHFRRALQVQYRLDAGGGATQHGLQAALDCLATGAILVDVRGAILFANTSARTSLDAREGLHVDRGELRARLSRDTRALRRLIRDVTRDGVPGAGGVLWLEREHGPAQHVVVAPVPRVDGTPAAAGALVFVTSPTALLPSADLIRHAHRLSRVEADVAQRLLDGRSVREVGGELGVSINTVRFHLKNLFAKTGTSRQGDLIRVLAATAQVLVRPAADEPQRHRRAHQRLSADRSRWG